MSKTGLFRGNVIIKSQERVSFIGLIENYEKHEFLGVESKYLRVKEIKSVAISPYNPDTLSVIFEGYFDEEAIERDKNKTEEDALVERVTKAVLEKLEEKKTEPTLLSDVINKLGC